MELPVCFNTSDQTQVTIGPWSYGLDFQTRAFFPPLTLLYGRVGFNCAHRKLDSDLENYGAPVLGRSHGLSLWSHQIVREGVSYV